MRNIIIVIFVFISSIITGQTKAETESGRKVLLFSDNFWCYADSVPLQRMSVEKIKELEVPMSFNKDEIVYYIGFTLSYNTHFKQANWVAYELTKEEINGNAERDNIFKVDPRFKNRSANNSDYSKSGYDRGHLAPAGDMKWNDQAMSESFFYTNISPQVPQFNRGNWKKLEEYVRAWADELNSIYVVTGPILKDKQKRIGRNKVTVPDFFYKVILSYNQGDVRGIGFVMPNANDMSDISYHAVTIDSVENLTGLDFFYLLPDDQESLIENQIDLAKWFGKAKQSQDKLAESVQCKGVTKQGTRCKNKTYNTNGFCHLHQSQAGSISNDKSTASKSSTPTILTGPRGGKYYINSNGKKVYIKRK